MRCYDEGTLRAYIDRELPIRQSDEVSRHLPNCAACRDRVDALQTAARLASSRLEALAPESVPPVEVARATVYRRLNDERPIGLGERLRDVLAGLRPAFSPARLAAVAVPVAVALTVVLTPAGSFASDFLAAFRVQEVQAIQIDPSTLPGMSEPENLGDLKMSAKPEIRSVTVQEAARATGLQLLGVRKVPDGFATKPLAFVSNPIEATMVYDYDKVAAYYDKKGLAGKPPAEIAGLTIKGSVSPVAVFFYASQESLTRLQESANSANTNATPTKEQARAVSQSSPKMMVLVQTHTPVIEFPSSVDVGKLRNEVLASGAVPPELAAQLGAIDSWQTTLPVPVVEGSSRDVTVAGVHGVLTTSPDEGVALIWQKGDVSYGLFGAVSESELLAAAESLAVAR